MLNAGTARVNVPVACPLATDTVPEVENVVAGSVAARGDTVNVLGLEPVKTPPESDQSPFTSNVAVPSCLPVTVMLIVMEPLPPGASVTLPVGAVTSTTATATELARAATVAATVKNAVSATSAGQKNRLLLIEVLLLSKLLYKPSWSCGPLRPRPIELLLPVPCCYLRTPRTGRMGDDEGPPIGLHIRP